MLSECLGSYIQFISVYIHRIISIILIIIYPFYYDSLLLVNVLSPALCSPELSSGGSGPYRVQGSPPL